MSWFFIKKYDRSIQNIQAQNKRISTTVFNIMKQDRHVFLQKKNAE